MSNAFEGDLRAGLGVLQLDLNDEQVGKLLDYQDLIGKWTKVYNLTAIRDPADMLTHHLLDSLAAITPLQRQLKQMALEQGGRLLDVGSGAGLPGVVMAICCPSVFVTCVDTVAKKAAFIKQAAFALMLPNLTGMHARVESIEQPFDVICSRAFVGIRLGERVRSHARPVRLRVQPTGDGRSVRRPRRWQTDHSGGVRSERWQGRLEVQSG